MQLKYIVTGTGRCGTVFVARFLTSLGVPCGHESVFDWRGLNHAIKIMNGERQPQLSHASSRTKDKWLDDPAAIVAESSYMAAPFLGEPILAGLPIIHVVRDPVKVANSFCNHIDYFKLEKPTNSYEHFIYKHIPELKQSMSVFERTALYIVRWNEMIEQHNPQLFCRVEDDHQKLKDFFKIQGDGFTDDTVNTFKKWAPEPFQIHKVASREIRQQFIQLARRYGYHVTNWMMV